MTAAELDAMHAMCDGWIVTHWDGCHTSHPRCAVLKLVAEVRRLRAELEQQKAATLATAERLAECSAVLGRAAERGKVCKCQGGRADQ